MTKRRTLGPIMLNEGVGIGHALSFVVVAMASVGLLVFINFLQPYLLYGQIAALPGALGRTTSRISIMHEVVVMVCVAPFGALLDRFGRPVVYAVGLSTLGVALALCSCATSLSALVGARFIFALGAAATAVGLAAVAADYPDDSARGRFLGLLLVTQQLTILLLVANVAAKLPGWLVQHGMEPVLAGQITFRVAAVTALIGAGFAYFGLLRGRPPGAGARAAAARQPLWRMLPALATIAAHARANPRLRITYLVAFVARGDTAIMTGFLSLYAVKTATAGGLAPADAMAAAGSLLGAATVGGIAGAFAVGWMADRVERTALLTIALAAAAAGNAALALIHGIDQWIALATVGCIAAAETAVIICGQTLLGEQAPPALRGAAVGTFGVCGSLGVLTLLIAGGLLFDRIAPQAPFMMLGVVNLLAVLPAALTWLRPARRGTIVQPLSPSNL